LDANLTDKKVVFLGESEHHIGSDFLAKTEFVKYLVLEKGYKDIAFEADFFGLYFEHDKIDLKSFWSRSIQCEELFEFLKAHNVTILGFDNQKSSGYIWTNLTNQLTKFIKNNSISFNKKYTATSEKSIKNSKKAAKVVSKSHLEY